MDTLIIIGNGFDRAHGIPSSYWHYHEYLKQNNHGWMADMLENYFGRTKQVAPFKSEKTLWSNLEEALGEYNVEGIYAYLKDGHDFDVDHPTASEDAIDAEVLYHFINIKKGFQESFCEWCRDINTHLGAVSQLPLPHFDPNARFLSFNYSDTLESVYHIPSSQIVHMHGRAATDGDELVVGHNNPASMPKKIKEGFIDEENHYRNIVSTINELVKDTTKHIQRHGAFFQGLSNVDNIVCYGHSLADVDIPYFREVLRSVKPTAIWNVSFHEPSEQVKILSQLGKIGVPAGQTNLFRI